MDWDAVDDPDDVLPMVEPLHAELAGLDRSLAPSLWLMDLRWIAGPQGRTLPTLRLAGITILVTSGALRRTHTPTA